MRDHPDLTDFAHTTWDIVVVGAGPAGAMAARECARLGASVLLVEKSSWPRYKVCGCCLNLHALASLEEAGLGALVHQAGAQPIHRFEMRASNRRAIVPLPGGVALSRGKLDAELVREAESSGAVFVPETTARLSSGSDAARAVILKGRNGFVTITAKIVLAADGLGGRLLKSAQDFQSPPTEDSRIGAGTVLEDAPAAYEAGTIHMACGVHGYVGLVRIEDGGLDVAAAFDADWVKQCGGLAEAAMAVLAEAGFEPVPGLLEAAWKGTPPLTRRATTLSAHRFLVLGDAAGYVEPFTGEGIAWALASGRAIAPIASGSVLDFNEETQLRWECMYREVITKRQVVCRLISLGLRRPSLVRTATAALAAAPALARPVVNHLNAPTTHRKANWI
jgi:flavin-dependent dehydrogenase